MFSDGNRSQTDGALVAGPVLGGAEPSWEQFRLAQVPSQLAPRTVELGAGPNWEQLVQLA